MDIRAAAFAGLRDLSPQIEMVNGAPTATTALPRLRRRNLVRNSLCEIEKIAPSAKWLSGERLVSSPWKQKKTLFTKVLSQRAHVFVHCRPRGVYADLTSKLQREQTTGTPPFWHVRARAWARAHERPRCYKPVFFLIARRHRIQPPSKAGVGVRSWVETHRLFSKVFFSGCGWRLCVGICYQAHSSGNRVISL